MGTSRLSGVNSLLRASSFAVEGEDESTTFSALFALPMELVGVTVSVVVGGVVVVAAEA
jgi:hypothetical protein